MKPLTRRATAGYRQATPEQVTRGYQWYPEAHALALSLSSQDGSISLETVVGIIAATSPLLGWGANVMLTKRILQSGGTLRHGALGNSLLAARRIYAGEDPLDVLKGPKTRAFYQAILSGGTSQTAVIDRHAWDMLTGVRQAPRMTRKDYWIAEAMMQKASDILGVGVHEVQATTWIVQREKFWSETANNYREEVAA